MVDTNIIPFPKEKLPSPPNTMEEVIENLEYFRMCHVQDALEMIIPQLFNQVSVIGFDNFDETDPNAERLGAMIVESIRAYMCYHHGLPHCFKDLSTGIFTSDEDGELILDNSLTVVFKKKDIPQPPDDKKKKGPKEK